MQAEEFLGDVHRGGYEGRTPSPARTDLAGAVGRERQGQGGVYALGASRIRPSPGGCAAVANRAVDAAAYAGRPRLPPENACEALTISGKR